MRKQLFTAISSALTGEGTGIAHVELWNDNVDFLEQEQAFATPAVFVEFDDIEWQHIKDSTMRCRSTFRLHIVTTYNSPSDSTDAFDLCERVQAIMASIASTEDYCNIMLTGSSTNNSHEDLLDTVETYSYTGVRTVGVWPEPEPVGPPR